MSSTAIGRTGSTVMGIEVHSTTSEVRDLLSIGGPGRIVEYCTISKVEAIIALVCCV